MGNTFIKYSLTAEEVENFTGRIKAGGLIVDLDSSDFPNIQGSDKQTINKDDATPYTLTLSGNFLTAINNGGNITGSYGTSLSRTTLGVTADDNSLVLTNATNPGRLGYQNIVLKKSDSVSDPAIDIEYPSSTAFRIIEDLGMTD